MNFMVWLAFILLNLMQITNADSLAPSRVVSTSAPVLDLVIRQQNIWAGTSDGFVLQLDHQGNLLSSLSVPLMMDHRGDKIKQRVMSIDASVDGQSLILGAEDGHVYVVRNGKLSATSFSTEGVIKRVVFASDQLAIIALLDSQIIFFDITNSKVIHNLSGGTSTLSDMVISPDRKTVAIVGEAGIVSLIDVATMKVIKHLKGGNVDNVYKLDFQYRHLLTAGQDRRAILYAMDGTIKQRFEGEFLIYSVALSPNILYAAVTRDEQNDITIFDLNLRQPILKAVGHNATLNRMAFITDKKLVSSADENQLLFWELP